MIENNEAFELAYNIIERTDTSVFLTGRAGTGKTTFLRQLVQRSSKQIVVAAPTGIAAINAGGVTLHSLFQLDFGLFLPGMNRKPLKFSRNKLRLLRFMDLLVIDEVSMVRADLLDAVDDVLRRVRNPDLPFGGVQLLLIGDLMQLPPVVTESERTLLESRYPTPYFFSGDALRATHYVTIELTKVYRQEDDKFLDILGAIRQGQPSNEILEALNSRYIPLFKPEKGKGWIYLTSHNASSHHINEERLKALSGKPYSFRACIKGTFPEGAYPADEILVLKVGAQIMFTKNDPQPAKKFFNGMLGVVTSIDEQSVRVAPQEGGAEITVGRLDWENKTYKINASTGQIEEKIEGVFSQIPLRTAWAITIHKSQGLTFSHAIVDVSSCFAHGQAYVALSRLRSLEGLVLSSPVPSRAIISDPQVSGFMSANTSEVPGAAAVVALEKQCMLNLLDSLYDCTIALKLIDELGRNVIDAYHSTYPDMVTTYNIACKDFEKEVATPAKKFIAQYTRMAMCPNPLPSLNERLKASASYFPDKIAAFVNVLKSFPSQIDNSSVAARLREKRDEVRDVLSLKHQLILRFLETPFSIESFQAHKRKIMLEIERRSASGKNNKSAVGAKKEKEVIGNVANPALFKALVAWRRKIAAERGLPAFRIIATRTLIQIASRMPQERRELLDVKGCGPHTVEHYGDDILSIVAQFVNG